MRSTPPRAHSRTLTPFFFLTPAHSDAASQLQTHHPAHARVLPSTHTAPSGMRRRLPAGSPGWPWWSSPGVPRPRKALTPSQHAHTGHRHGAGSRARAPRCTTGLHDRSMVCLVSMTPLAQRISLCSSSVLPARLVASQTRNGLHVAHQVAMSMASAKAWQQRGAYHNQGA